MAKPLTAVVTGSNRGIGKAIVEKLARTRHHSPLAIYATSRKGLALDISPLYHNEIHYAQLDITDTSSISAFFQQPFLQGKPIDILINNAGVNLDYNGDDQDKASKAHRTISINYEGTKQVCLAFLDANGGKMASNSGSRIINLSSAAASLRDYPKDLQRRFRKAQTIADVDALGNDYVSALSASESEAEKQGWIMPSYSVSKALVNALTSVLAQSSDHQNVLINCCDPGWVFTDMGTLVGNPPKTEEEGARIPVKLALDDINGTSGKFWGNRDVSSSASGRVLAW